ncbi:hypothetical protein [Vibrio sp. CAU 1672]|uniref:hypothetical protein n=1 Tax=Vibrio sp. CAU 1672 TaxID=3032594 RepID=UPI0023D9C8FE|nr:hypothetical protein [Vibrio sp. CAU 1672]MDF2154707.1 hypothetical protein [Vibrio sp. CAU 1672]
MKPTPLFALSALLMSGCQLTSSQPIEPYATEQHYVKTAQTELNKYEELEVSEDGLITFTAGCLGQVITGKRPKSKS